MISKKCLNVYKVSYNSTIYKLINLIRILGTEYVEIQKKK